MVMLCNFFHIKTSNGLFFYGIDYIKENLDIVHLVLVRPALEEHVRKALPGISVIPCSTLDYLIEIVRAATRGHLIFTPSSHPFPFVSHQCVVFHDYFPFQGSIRSFFKRCILELSLKTSRCRVAYINRTEAQQFLKRLGVREERMIFAPNRFPERTSHAKRVPEAMEITVVGLLGTDSPKKNYDSLFRAVRLAELSSQLHFRVFGHNTPYYQKIKSSFPDLQFHLIESDKQNMEDFIVSVDVLASASSQEGFGRPIASALLAGVPVELLDSAVFREFFSGGARFHRDLDMLALSLPNESRTDMPTTSYQPPSDVVDAFTLANEELHRLASDPS